MFSQDERMSASTLSQEQNFSKTYVHWICRAKKEVGRTCKNHNFPEINLKKISVEILELEEFDEDIFTQQIEKITVLADGSLAFKFYEGRTKVWQKA